MAVIDDNTFRPPWWLRNRHLQTIVPALTRDVPPVPYARQRLETGDGDFVDVDWLVAGNRRLAILLPGLESDSGQRYVRAMVRALYDRRWDVAVLNARGCSGEPNRLLRSYHGGETADLDLLVRTTARRGDDRPIALLGFSLGGNQALRYAGQRSENLDPRIRAVAAVSVPCDLGAAAEQMARPANRIYMSRFARLFQQKMRHKAARFPDAMDWSRFERIHSFHQFDAWYTAPVHGFESAEHYWRSSSCRPLIPRIRRPTVILNALDDPFLAESCHPRREARRNDAVTLVLTRRGGHVGFIPRRYRGETWHETRVAEFLEKQVPAATHGRSA